MGSETRPSLAIDAGATHSSFALFVDPERPLRSGSCRGFNYSLHGRSGLEELFGIVFGALAEGGGEPPRPPIVGLAVAGAGRPDARVRALRDLAAVRDRIVPDAGVYLFHDGESALYRALGGGVGVVVSAGTGSIGYGRRADGAEARVGGWGHLVGDEGSAWWIAARALAAALRSWDGRQPAAALAEAVTRAAGCAEPPELVAWLHDPARGKDEVAALARVVSELALSGDEAAAAICGAAGEELALVAATVARRLGLGERIEVGIAGGVLLDAAPVRDAMAAAVAKLLPGARLVRADRPPEVGAALLLAERARCSPPHLPARWAPR